MKPISKENFLAIRNAEGSHRKIFTKTGIKENKDIPYFSVSFYESIGPIYEKMTGNKLEKHSSFDFSTYYSHALNESNIDDVKAWEQMMGNYVFLRDCLFASIALDMNQTPQSTTDLGIMFRILKYEPSQQETERLIYENVTSAMVAAIRKLPYYKDAKYIACVPPSPEKQVDIPSNLAKRIADKLNLTDITERFSFAGKKESAKNLPMREKWDAWERAGLKMNYNLEGKDVILIDDLYQSGTTVNYTAMVLQRANVGRILGLYVVKSMRDTDNQ